LPSTGACGVATLPPPAGAECRTSDPVMPTFARMRELTQVSRLRPLIASIRSPADHVEHIVVGVGAAEAGRRRDEAQPAGDLLPVICRFGHHSRPPAPSPRPLRWTSRSRTVISRVRSAAAQPRRDRKHQGVMLHYRDDRENR
jgi:hypothetical protein